MTDDRGQSPPGEGEPVTEQAPAAPAPSAASVPPLEASVPPSEAPAPAAPALPGASVPPPAPVPVPPPLPAPVAPDAEPSPSPLDRVAALVSARPEVGVGGAFVGGLVLAQILRRLGR